MAWVFHPELIRRFNPGVGSEHAVSGDRSKCNLSKLLCSHSHDPSSDSAGLSDPKLSNDATWASSCLAGQLSGGTPHEARRKSTDDASFKFSWGEKSFKDMEVISPLCGRAVSCFLAWAGEVGGKSDGSMRCETYKGALVADCGIPFSFALVFKEFVDTGCGSASIQLATALHSVGHHT